MLNILNFVCLLLSTFEKVHSQTKQLKEIKENLTILYTLELEENKTLDLSNFVTQSIISAVTLTAVVREKRQASEGEGRLYPPHSGEAHEHDATTQDPTQFAQTTYYEEQLEGRLIKPKMVDTSNFFENFSIYNNQTEKPIDALFTPIKLNVTTPSPPTPSPVPSRQPPPSGPRQPPPRKRPRPTTTTTTVRPRPNATRPVKPILKPDETAENATELATLIYQLDENTTALIDGNFTEEGTGKRRKWPITTTPLPNCTQEEEVVIDPFKLFEFAQKLEREGFQNYTTILKGLWWV